MSALPSFFLAAISAIAGASPCAGVDRALAEAQRQALSPALARQLRVSSVDVLASMTIGNWSIVSVSTHNTDPPFLFFSGNPANSHYVTLWSGAAKQDERTEIEAWVLRNAPGIPSKLAACFAWHVTTERPS